MTNNPKNVAPLKLAIDSIDDIAIYVPGKSAAGGTEKPLKLSANENPHGCSPKALAAMETMCSEAHRYPDGSSIELTQAIAKLHNLPETQIVCGAGSDELLALICQAFAGKGDEVLLSEHGFLMYPICAKRVGAKPVEAPETKRTTNVDALLANVTNDTKIVFIANPNNPTATYINASELARLRAGLREDILLVVDNAYMEYVTADDYGTGYDLVAGGNVVVTHTFSKAYGLGGLRIGWSYASEAITEVLHKIRGPFNLSNVAQAAGVAALEDQNFIASSVAQNSKERDALTEACEALGLKVGPSQTNFVLVDCGSESEAERINSELMKRGIIVRQVSAYKLPECLRVTIGTATENAQLITALNDIMA